MPGRSTDRVGEHDWHDARYVDRWIAERIDGDAVHLSHVDRLAGLVAASIAVGRPRVLDIGTGPGVLASAMLRALPGAHVVCQDFSSAMLDRARSSLAWAAGRVTFHLSDLASAEWYHGIDPPFDAVVSSYAIHNLRDTSRIGAVYAEAAGLVAPGGCLFLLDLVESPGPHTDILYGRRRREDDDGPATLSAHLAWLVATGLRDVDCVWKESFEVALCGFRP